jgi:hypothetical protein
MEQDTIKFDSLASRPLPKWLTDQKEGLITIQPKKIIIRQDHYLSTSFMVTGAFVLLVVITLTVIILRNNKKKLT